MARRPATLTLVMRWKQRLAAGAVAGFLFATQCVVNAAAEIETPVLDSALCDDMPATDEDKVSDSWHLDRLKMDQVWPMATGKGVKVAVIDTGTSTAGTLFLPETRVRTFDLIGPNEDGTQIDCVHGTAVTALLAGGRTETGEAIHPGTNFSGIAPDAEIYAYRALDSSAPVAGDEERSLQPTVQAFRAAIEAGVDIINFSAVVGSNDPAFPELREVVREAIYDHGIVVVAAAGNAQQAADVNSVAFPAAFDGVISVGISNVQDLGDSETIPGSWIDIGAPGRGLVTLQPSNAKERTVANQSFNNSVLGTSYAAPLVSGVVALMLENDRRLAGDDPNYVKPTPEQIRQRLIETADPPSTSVPNPYIGYGIVNPSRALMGAIAPAPANPAGEQTPAADPFPEPEEPELFPRQLGLGLGIGAAALTAFGVGAAIAIPAARRTPR